MSMTDACMVILSGGQDSTTALFWAKQRFTTVHAVTFDYGQRHHLEITAAIRIAELAKVATSEIVNLRGALRSASPLLGGTKLETYPDFETMDQVIGDRIELTFVPMRNLVFLTVALNRAIALGVNNLVIGVCQADNANYPDCRQSFIDAAQDAMIAALGQDRDSGADQVWIYTPLMDNSKAETVRMAQELPGCFEALAYSHTCYAGKFPPCGECHACVLRAHGFAEAGVADPLIERAKAR